MRRCSRPTALATVALALAAGCSSGSVKVEEQDKFGRAHSYWFEFEQDYDGDSYTYHSFVISNRGGLCKDVQRAMPELASAAEELYESYDDFNSYEDICEAYKGIFTTYADALDPLYKGGGNFLSLSIIDPDEDGEDPPEPDEYVHGSDADSDEKYFYGSLSYYQDNPWRMAADATDCSNADDTTEWYYDWYEELEDAVEMFYLSDGNLVVEQKNDTKYRIVLEEGELEDDEGDGAGDIEAKGTFSHCKVEYEGYAYLYL